MNIQNSAQLELMFGLVKLEFRLGLSFLFFFGGGGLNLFSYVLSSLVSVRLHTDNWLCNLPGSALKVTGGWWWVSESKLSDQLWLSFSLALAKPNNCHKCILLILSSSI